MLSATDKKELEKTIEFAKALILPKFRYVREPEASAKLMIKTPEDYVLGQMVGFVLGAMNEYFRISKQRIATREETAELMAILNERISDFRNELFKQA